MTLDDLETMDRATLIVAWTSLFDMPVPKGLSKPLMRRFLSTELQTRRHGGLTKTVKKVLRSEAPAKPPKSPGLKPGGRLLREWNGVTHAVEVTDDGYHWNGEGYHSLSAIARAITGAHWSGPRFFGLTGGKTR